MIKKENQLFCISRNENNGLINLAKNEGVSLEYICFNLLDVNKIKGIMEDIFLQIRTEEVESIVLINNAGAVTPIKSIETQYHH